MRLFFLIFILLFILLSCQQTGFISHDEDFKDTNVYTISGTVYDKDDNRMQNIKVTINGPVYKKTSTDINGNFSFTNLSPSEYRINSDDKNFIFIPSIGENRAKLTDNLTVDFYAYELSDVYESFTGELLPVHRIQGRHHLSEYDGIEVSDVMGVVIAASNSVVSYQKYQEVYIQELYPDNDIRTSEGIKIITSYENPGDYFNSGDVIIIKKGLVEESIQNIIDGSYYNENIPRTQIRTPLENIVKIRSGIDLPAPITMDDSDRPVPAVYFSADDNVERDICNPASSFDPLKYALDYYESIEHMYVELPRGVVSGGLDSYSAIFVLPDNGSKTLNRTLFGGAIIGEDYTNFNPGIVAVSDLEYGDYLRNVKVGDKFTDSIYGVIDYSYKRYKLLVFDDLPAAETFSAPQTTKIIKDKDTLTIAGYNVENLSPPNTPNGNATRFKEIAHAIVYSLHSPDIIGLIEVQDDSGNTDDSTVESDRVMDMLIEEVQIINNNNTDYDYRYIAPIDGEEGGEPVGNIRVVFLFDRNRVSFVDRPTAKEIELNPEIIYDLPTKAVEINKVGSEVELSVNPGRIEPLNEYFDRTRKSLIGEFLFNGEKIFVILNHFSAKGGDEPLQGRFQPPLRESEINRVEQAKVIDRFIGELLEADPDAKIVSLGDFNDFHFSETARISDDKMTNLVYKMPVNQRFTYNYEGNSQTLDNFQVSDAIMKSNPSVDIVHVNTMFSHVDQNSDHDPIIAGINFGSFNDSGNPSFMGNFPVFTAKAYRLQVSAQSNIPASFRYVIRTVSDNVPLYNEVLNGVDHYGQILTERENFAVYSNHSTLYDLAGLVPDTDYKLYYLLSTYSGKADTVMKTYDFKTLSLGDLPPCSDLFISEVVEGYSYNRAIEVFNGTGGDVDLSNYTLHRDKNGDGDFDYRTLSLSGTLTAGEVYVIAHNSATLFDSSVIDITESGVTGFNGDDRIVLKKSGTIIDYFGIDGGGMPFNADSTFIRVSDISEPNSISEDPRLNNEWIIKERDYNEDLGSHKYDP